MKIPFLKLRRGRGHGHSSVSALNRRNGCAGSFGAQTTRTRAEECDSNSSRRPLNPEGMIFRLEVDERGEIHRRKSHATCSDDNVVASATNALRECPRFSLDGRDAKYQYSFRSPDTAGSFEEELKKDGFDVALKNGRTGLPAATARGTPLWCKPSVVGRLMGLDAMPVRAA